MSLYYHQDGITIFHGSCLDVMPTLPTGIAAIITDPPYGETSLAWDKRLDGWAEMAHQITAESASLWCFGSLRMFIASGGLKPWTLAQDIVWEKHNGSGMHADRFKRVHEHAVHFYKGDWAALYKSPVHTNDATARVVRRKEKPTHMGAIAGRTFVSEDGGPRLMRSVIYARSCHGTAVHPTQKPEAILMPLIEYSSAPGSVVVDLFAGPGSTLVACKAMGRQAIGIEINEAYCEAAAKRLAQGTLSLA